MQCEATANSLARAQLGVVIQSTFGTSGYQWKKYAQCASYQEGTNNFPVSFVWYKTSIVGDDDGNSRLLKRSSSVESTFCGDRPSCFKHFSFHGLTVGTSETYTVGWSEQFPLNLKRVPNFVARVPSVTFKYTDLESRRTNGKKKNNGARLIYDIFLYNRAPERGLPPSYTAKLTDEILIEMAGSEDFDWPCDAESNATVKRYAGPHVLNKNDYIPAALTDMYGNTFDFVGWTSYSKPSNTPLYNRINTFRLSGDRRLSIPFSKSPLPTVDLKAIHTWLTGYHATRKSREWVPMPDVSNQPVGSWAVYVSLAVEAFDNQYGKFSINAEPSYRILR